MLRLLAERWQSSWARRQWTSVTQFCLALDVGADMAGLQIPPATRISRPGEAAGFSASPIMTSRAPTATNTSVITHRSAAPTAARELTVLVTELKEPGCSQAASVHPPTSSTGAAADETTPHHGTSRTTPP